MIFDTALSKMLLAKISHSEAEQIPCSPVDVIGQSNKLTRLERRSIGNVWRFHKSLFPNSRRRQMLQITAVAWALCILALLVLFGFVAGFRVR